MLDNVVGVKKTASYQDNSDSSDSSDGSTVPTLLPFFTDVQSALQIYDTDVRTWT